MEIHQQLKQDASRLAFNAIDIDSIKGFSVRVCQKSLLPDFPTVLAFYIIFAKVTV